MSCCVVGQALGLLAALPSAGRAERLYETSFSSIRTSSKELVTTNTNYMARVQNNIAQ